MNDSITVSSIINETGENVSSISNHSVWLYVVLFVVFVSIVIGILTYYKSERYKNKKKLLDAPGNIDFNNVMNNAFLSKNLYDELKSKCHPDKFEANPILCAKATEIMALIVKNKHNYQELCQLKERAIRELDIN